MTLGQKQKKLSRTMRIAILAIFLIVFLFPQSTSADTLDDKKRELNEIQNQIDQQQESLNQKKKEKQSLQNQVSIMDGQIRQTELSIQATQGEIDLAQAEIEKLKTQIKQKEKELAYQKEVLNETIRVIYEETDTNFLEMLFSSDNISEVLDRTEYLGAIEGKITDTMAEMNKIKTALAKDQKEQEQKKADKEVLLAQFQATKSALDMQEANKNSLLDRTRGQESAYQAELAKIRALYNATNSELKRMEEAARGGSDAPSMAGFYWPVKGYITAYFCDPSYPFSGCHSGIDIGTYGASLPVAASRDGVVTNVVDGWGNTYPYAYIYGNYVEIDHGNGFRTRYAHLAAGMIRVNPGDKVSGGKSIIGYVDNSGFSTGTHLHFEVRYGGIPVNPLNYLP